MSATAIRAVREPGRLAQADETELARGWWIKRSASTPDREEIVTALARNSRRVSPTSEFLGVFRRKVRLVAQ